MEALWYLRGEESNQAWLEDARAFMTKLELARKHRLRGFSVWLLGLEDPATWKALRDAGVRR